ncbi:DNA-3-methyladenine glycosylase 2 family protein [Pelagibacterales bacterium SAG-MED32]|nr:DNA-3-methyladenine glycosylase 2 family protein [Pelagibacterales bacterium SAG-MED32]
MKKPFFWEKAKKELIKRDSKLGSIIKSYPKDFLFTKSDPFYTLARSIVGQQISVKAAQAVWGRLESKIKNIRPLSIKKSHFMTMKSSGLSRQKITYLKSLADAFILKKIEPLKWDHLRDEEIIEELIQIKGIGRWTAEMFLIFNLCRPDIFPADDLGVIKGICECYNLKYPITKDHAIKMSLKWSPYRSVATWYFWRSLDPIPVEY